MKSWKLIQRLIDPTLCANIPRTLLSWKRKSLFVSFKQMLLRLIYLHHRLQCRITLEIIFLSLSSTCILVKIIILRHDNLRCPIELFIMKVSKALSCLANESGVSIFHDWKCVKRIICAPWASRRFNGKFYSAHVWNLLRICKMLKAYAIEKRRELWSIL